MKNEKITKVIQKIFKKIIKIELKMKRICKKH